MRRIFVSCILFAVCLTALHIDASGQRRGRDGAGLKIGDPAPDFTLPGVDGRDYSLADFADRKILVFVFTANHCPTAQAYEERVMQLHDDYGDRGVAVVMISPNDPLAIRLDEMGYTDVQDSFADMQYRAAMQGFTFPYLYDGETQAMSREYGPLSTPHVFIFDASRRLAYVGRIDDREDPAKVTSRDTRNAIEALLAGTPVPTPVTKTFGCSVKWSDKRPAVQAALDKWALEPVALEPINVSGIESLVRNETDKLRVINVWATWCGPCVTEFPELVSINRMYRKRPFEMITISADLPEKQAEALAFLQEQQASMQNYIFDSDDKYALIEAVDPEWAGALPYTLLVAPGGEVLYGHMGEINPLEVKTAIVNWVGRTYYAVPGEGP